jgi:actin-like protein 6A
VLPLIVVVEISLQLHRSLILINLRGLAQTIPGMEKFGAEANAPLQGLPQMVIDSINKCDVDIRRKLFSSIMVS